MDAMCDVRGNSKSRGRSRKMLLCYDDEEVMGTFERQEEPHRSDAKGLHMRKQR